MPSHDFKLGPISMSGHRTWKKSDKCVQAEVKNKMETARLSMRKKLFERQKMRTEFLIEKDKRQVSGAMRKMQDTSGFSLQAMPPDGPHDLGYEQTPFFQNKSAVREKQLQRWRATEKEVERSVYSEEEKILRPPWEKDPYENITQSFNHMMRLLGYEVDSTHKNILQDKVQKSDSEQSLARPTVPSSSPGPQPVQDVFRCLKSSGQDATLKSKRFNVNAWEKKAMQNYVNVITKPLASTGVDALQKDKVHRLGGKGRGVETGSQARRCVSAAEMFRRTPTANGNQGSRPRTADAGKRLRGRTVATGQGLRPHTTTEGQGSRPQTASVGQGSRSQKATEVRPHSAHITLQSQNMTPQSSACMDTNENSNTPHNLHAKRPYKTPDRLTHKNGQTFKYLQRLSSIAENDTGANTNVDSDKQDQLVEVSRGLDNLGTVNNQCEEAAADIDRANTADKNSQLPKTNLPSIGDCPTENPQQTQSKRSILHNEPFDASASEPANNLMVPTPDKPNDLTNSGQVCSIECSPVPEAGDDQGLRNMATSQTASEDQRYSNSGGRPSPHPHTARASTPLSEAGSDRGALLEQQVAFERKVLVGRDLPQWKRDLLIEAPPSVFSMRTPLKVGLVMSKAQRKRELEQMVDDNIRDIRGLVDKEQNRRFQARLKLFLTINQIEQTLDMENNVVKISSATPSVDRKLVH